MVNVYIIATDNKISALLEAVSTVAAPRVLAVGVDPASLTGEVTDFELAADQPVEALAPAVAAAITGPALVVASNTSAGRALAGFVAGKLGAALVSGARSFSANEKLTANRDAYGSQVVQEVSTGGSLVAIMDGGKDVSGGDANVTAAAGDTFDAKVTGQAASGETSVDLSAAKRIVSVGRGFKEESELRVARDLAAKAGAEIACSRPIAEGQGWIEKARYIGVTGQHVVPEIYFALGISGQLQHMVGCHDAKVIVAVNNDDKAPIFSQCDYGIVGNVTDVVPAITAAL